MTSDKQLIVHPSRDDDNEISRLQENNVVGGDMAAGDIHKNYNLPAPHSPLRVMAENYRHEIEQDNNHQEFIDELQDYMKRVPGIEQRNLEEKLLAAKRDDLVVNAKHLKEQFTKKIYKHTFSPTAQNIFVHILAKINSCFRLRIKPLIHENSSPRTVDEAIYKEIVECIYMDVGNSELSINMDDIHGMLFYLTGNCYIEWD
jgi:hypothetical protein